MKYQHLLVPVVTNDPDQRALDAAFELAQQHGASTTLIYVIEAIDEAPDAPVDDDLKVFYAEVEQSVRGRLNEMSQRFEHAGLNVRCEIIVGHTAQTIVRYSAVESVDLIVMRSERIDLNRPETAMASPSHQVSVFCQCPVILLK